MDKENELYFYEGMFAIQFCFILIFSILLILSVVWFIIDHNLFYIPIGIMGGYLITAIAVYLLEVKLACIVLVLFIAKQPLFRGCFFTFVVVFFRKLRMSFLIREIVLFHKMAY